MDGYSHQIDNEKNKHKNGEPTVSRTELVSWLEDDWTSWDFSSPAPSPWAACSSSLLPGIGRQKEGVGRGAKRLRRAPLVVSSEVESRGLRLVEVDTV